MKSIKTLPAGAGNRLIIKTVSFFMSVAMFFAGAGLGNGAGVAATVYAADKSVSSLKKEYNELEEELKQLKKDLDKLEDRENDYMEQVSNLNSQINIIEDQIDSVNEQIELLGQNIDDMGVQIEGIEGQISDIETQIEVNYEKFKERLKAIYTSGEESELEILLSSKSLKDFFNRYALIKAIADRDRALMNGLRDDIFLREDQISELEEAKTEVQNQKEDTEKLKETLSEKQSELKMMKSQAEATLKKIKSDETAKEKAIKEIDKSLDELEDEIKKATQKSTGTYVGGKFTWPCPSSSRISSPFGYRHHPITGVYKLHKGVDIAAAKNSAIVAANDGKVTTVKYGTTGYGKYVIIDHGGGYLTLYAHCNSISVKEGQTVKKGDQIAKVGMTGSATGYHLHFEIRINNDVVDPMDYFKKK